MQLPKQHLWPRNSGPFGKGHSSGLHGVVVLVVAVAAAAAVSAVAAAAAAAAVSAAVVAAASADSLPSSFFAGKQTTGFQTH